MSNTQYQAGVRFGHALAIQQTRDLLQKIFNPAVTTSIGVALDRISMAPLPSEPAAQAAAAAFGSAHGAPFPDPVTGGLLAIAPMYMTGPQSPHSVVETPHSAAGTPHSTAGAPHSAAGTPYSMAKVLHTPTRATHLPTATPHSETKALPEPVTEDDPTELTIVLPIRRRGRKGKYVTHAHVPAAIVEAEVEEVTATTQLVRKGGRSRTQVSYAEPSLTGANLEEGAKIYVLKHGRQTKHASKLSVDSEVEEVAIAQPVRKRGRPRKNALPGPSTGALVIVDLEEEEEEEDEQEEEAQSRKRSCQSENTSSSDTIVKSDLQEEEAPVQAPRRRGRPRKAPQAGQSVLAPLEGGAAGPMMRYGRGRKKALLSNLDEFGMNEDGGIMAD